MTSYVCTTNGYCFDNSTTNITTSSGGVGGSSSTIYYYQSKENQMERCGISINCDVPNYAYNGLDFALHCIGLAIIILACTCAYNFYKRNNKIGNR